MFGYVMSDPARCKTFVEHLLNIRIDHVELLDKQKTIDEKIDARGVRLDIYMDDGATIYSCEMQTARQKDMPERMRYYQGEIDISQLRAGEPYSKLKKCLIIFICTFDFIGKGRYMYTFSNRCEEDPSIELGDGTKKILINTRGTVGNVTKEFRDLMNYMNNPSYADDTDNGFIKELDRLVRESSTYAGWQHDYFKWARYGVDKHQEGFEEGFEEGIENGRQKGAAETEAVYGQLIRLLSNEKRYDDIVKMASDADYRRKLAEEFGI